MIKKVNKLNKWRKKLTQLETQDLPKSLSRLGISAPEGDWHENAEYEDAERQVELIRIKINEVKRIIINLEKEEKYG